jgi:hypothetical protein
MPSSTKSKSLLQLGLTTHRWDTVKRWIAATLVLAAFPLIASANEPIELARGAGATEPQQPQVAVGGDGAIHVVYGVRDVVHYRRSDDGGHSFTDAVKLPRIKNLSLGARRGPRIAVADKGICVTAIGGEQGKGRDGDLLAMHSADGGKTWSAPTRVNDVADAAREGLHGMAAGPRGQLGCVWLDLRNGGNVIMASLSRDGGASWSKNVLVYQSPSGSVCECCHPSVAFDAQGGMHVLWRNSLAGARDMYVASSTDGGKTFDPASKLGRGTWPLQACPMDGGALAVAPGGKLVSAWRREKTVYLSFAGQSEEQRLGPGEQPWIAATPEGPFVVWLKERGAALYLLTPGSETPTELTNDASDPVISASPTGRGPIVAAWESRAGTEFTIQFQVIQPGN